MSVSQTEQSMRLAVNGGLCNPDFKKGCCHIIGFALPVRRHISANERADNEFPELLGEYEAFESNSWQERYLRKGARRSVRGDSRSQLRQYSDSLRHPRYPSQMPSIRIHISLDCVVRSHGLITSPTSERSDPIRNISIETICKRQVIEWIELVKIDIEGFEKN